MEDIVKHINDTNASYRTPNAGDAKNTDLFLDNDHYELFKGAGDQITVRFSKENLSSGSGFAFLCAFIIAIIVIVKHHANLSRLAHGTESKFSFKKSKETKK